MSSPKPILRASGEARIQLPEWRIRWALTALAFLCLGQLICADSVQAASSITTTIAYDYDASGLFKKQMIEPGDSSLCLVVEHQRDTNYGRIAATTKRNCSGVAGTAPGAETEAAAPGAPATFLPRTSTFAPTTDQRFVAIATDAVGLSEAKTYDPRSGAVATLSDPNQVVSSWAYDSLGRRTGEIRPDGSRTRWDYVYCANGGIDGRIVVPTGAASTNCALVPVEGLNVYSTPIYYIQVTPVAADGVTPIAAYSRTYFDERGREMRSEAQGFDGTLIYRDTFYNGLGQVSRRSQPYYSGQTAYWTRYTYDVQGRVTDEERPTDTAAGGAVTHFAYKGLETTRTDPLGHSVTETRNVLGQVATILDARGGILTHAHDALGNLTGTQDALGNVITQTYDTRGRRLLLNDPDLGIVSTVYNAAGEPVSQTDAKGQVSTFTYDLIGRMTSRTEPSLTSHWYYDTTYADGTPCGRAKGRLCEANAGNSYARRHVYDELGRPVAVTSTIGVAYTARAGYDTYGRIASQTYPSGLVVTHSYTSLGYLERVKDGRNGAALWTAQAMDAAGRVTRYTYGNGVVSTDQYFAPSGRLGGSLSGTGGSSNVQSLTYSHDAGGRLAARTDLLTGVSATYGYDELDRLTSETRSGGNLPSPQTMAWAYNAIGNMESRTEGGVSNTYNYPSAGSARPHAVASVSGAVNGVASPSYGYDANGNVTSGAGRTLTWTSFDKVDSLSQGGKRQDYLYDTELQRVREIYSLNGTPQRTTIYLNPADGAGLFYEEETGVAGTKKKHYLSAGGSAFGVVTCGAEDCTVPVNTATQYWHKDHLGSIVVVTDAAGGVVERLAYEPFGKRRYPNGLTDTNGTLGAGTDRGYTGHEHLDEMGLINMNGRMFDPALGRFMSADPGVPYLFDLQSYNRYAYARNNPIGNIDPSGYEDGDGSPGDAGSLGSVTVTGSARSPGGPAPVFTIPPGSRNVQIRPNGDGRTTVTFLRPTEWNDNGIPTGWSNVFALIGRNVSINNEASESFGEALVARMIQRAEDEANGVQHSLPIAGKANISAMAGAIFADALDNWHQRFLAGEIGAPIGRPIFGPPIRAVTVPKPPLPVVKPQLPATTGLTVANFPQIATEVSQKQLRHIAGRPELAARGGGSYLNSRADAQGVLDAYHSGSATILGKSPQGFPVVRVDGITGTNVNVGAGFPSQPTNVFIIKGTASPSVVPTNPNWTP